ncbi:bacteriocin [Nostoc sp.]
MLKSRPSSFSISAKIYKTDVMSEKELQQTSGGIDFNISGGKNWWWHTGGTG